MRLTAWNRLVRGTVVVRRSSRLLTLVLLIVGALGVWEFYLVSTVTYTRRVDVSGEVTNGEPTVQVVAAGNGILTGSIPVPGQPIEDGDTLFAIESATANTIGSEQSVVTIDEKLRRISDSLEDIPRRREQYKTRHRHYLDTLENERQLVTSSLTTIQDRIDILAKHVDTMASSPTVFTSDELETAKLEWLGAQEQHDQLASQISRIDQRISQAEDTHHQRLTELDRREERLTLERLDLQSQREAQERAQGLTIVSAVEGFVAAVLVEQGQAVSQGQVLAIVEPDGEQNNPLTVRLHVPAHSGGSVNPGDEVWVELEPYPAREFGLFSGEVVSIAHYDSRSANNKPSFIVEATLDPRELRPFGDRAEIRRGMAVKAKLVTERLTLLEWLLEPVLVNLEKQASIPSTL